MIATETYRPCLYPQFRPAVHAGDRSSTSVTIKIAQPYQASAGQPKSLRQFETSLPARDNLA